MKTDDFKKRFIELFREMEEELGSCSNVEIQREDETSLNGEIVKSRYCCTMRF